MLMLGFTLNQHFHMNFSIIVALSLQPSFVSTLPFSLGFVYWLNLVPLTCVESEEYAKTKLQ